MFVCLFCCFKSQVNSYGHGGTVSTANHTFSWTSLNKWLTVLRAHTFACNWQQPFLNDSAEKRRMTVEIISWSISMKVWDRAAIELATPVSAVRLASVAKHVTNCAMRYLCNLTQVVMCGLFIGCMERDVMSKWRHHVILHLSIFRNI